MKKSKRIGIWVLLLGIVLLSLSVGYAAEGALQISLPVEQHFVVESQTAGAVRETGTYVLTAAEPETPLPEGSEAGTYVFSLTGTEEKAISLDYERTGKYIYTLQQITEDAPGYTYDRSCYTIRVYILNGEDGQLQSQVVVEKEQEKCGEIAFSNGCHAAPDNVPEEPEEPTTEEPVPTGDRGVGIWALAGLASLLGVVCLYGRRKDRRA